MSDEMTARLDAAVRLRTMADSMRPLYKIHDVIQPAQPPQSKPDQIVSGYRWFVAQIQPGLDAKAQRSLKEAGIKTFAPREAYWVMKDRMKVAKTKPLFPRYLFAGLPVNHRNECDTYVPKICDGVQDLLRWNGCAVSLPDELIGDLMWEDERRGLDFVWEKASENISKKLRAEIAAAMHEVLEADPEARMEIFMSHFGPKSKRRDHARETA